MAAQPVNMNIQCQHRKNAVASMAFTEGRNAVSDFFVHAERGIAAKEVERESGPPRQTCHEKRVIGSPSAALCVGPSTVPHASTSLNSVAVESRWSQSRNGKTSADEHEECERLTQLAQKTTTSVRKRVIRARCNCSRVRHRALPFFG